MTRFNRIAPGLFAAGALFFAVPAMAQDVSFPRVVRTGENASVEYGPGSIGTIVGGGAVTVRDLGGNEVQITHLEDRFAQPGRRGLRAVTIGSGESIETVWLPADGNIATALVTGRYTRG